MVDYWNCRGLSHAGLYSVSGTLILRKAAQVSILTENHSESLHCRERGGAPGWIYFNFKSNAILVYMELNGKKVAIQILGKIYCLL